MKSLTDWVSGFLAKSRLDHAVDAHPSMDQVNPLYEMVEPFSLGTYETAATKRRERKEIYTVWQTMQQDPSIAEALSLHVAAALGGHESRGDVVFMTPNQRIRGNGIRNTELRKKVNARSKKLTPIINKTAHKVCRDAVGYGDGYMRLYGVHGRGLVDALCNEYTFPPLIQAFEQGGRTIGFHILEQQNWINVMTKLTTLQMVRLKMPRVTHVPQVETIQGILRQKILEDDVQSNLPLVPSVVGGSFLFEVEEPWRNVHLALACMNSQQIADAVKQMFLSIDMSGMPPNQRKLYREGLTKILKGHEDHVRAALQGGDAIWATKYHVLPAWGDKQVLNPVGDISGQRTAPVNIEQLMLNVRRMMGGLGSDPSMVGWADMLAGGLGDGAAFHTNAQIMRRSIMIRQAYTDLLNQMAVIDWAYAYGEWLEPGDYPWQFEFYSDQSAAANEMNTNRNNRANTLMLMGQSLQVLRDVGLDKESNLMLLEDVAGMDLDKAEKIANGLAKAKKEAQDALNGGGDGGQDPDPNPDNPDDLLNDPSGDE